MPRMSCFAYFFILEHVVFLCFAFFFFFCFLVYALHFLCCYTFCVNSVYMFVLRFLL
jgi:hypothetical protein